jgi:hypothetical protein
LGTDCAIDYQGEFIGKVEELTDCRGVNIFYDSEAGWCGLGD